MIFTNSRQDRQTASLSSGAYRARPNSSSANLPNADRFCPPTSEALEKVAVCPSRYIRIGIQLRDLIARVEVQLRELGKLQRLASNPWLSRNRSRRLPEIEPQFRTLFD